MKPVMPMYLCRWPNGDCSAVWARDEQDATLKLDEVGDAEGYAISRLPEFQVHFRLTDEGNLELDDFGDETEPAIWRVCYPLLDRVEIEIMGEREACGVDELTGSQRERIRQAVVRERERVSAEAERAEGSDRPPERRVKQRTGAKTAAVDELIRDAGAHILRRLKRPRRLN